MSVALNFTGAYQTRKLILLWKELFNHSNLSLVGSGCSTIISLLGAGLFSANNVIELEVLLLPSFLFHIIIIIMIICQCHKEINKSKKRLGLAQLKKNSLMYCGNWVTPGTNQLHNFTLWALDLRRGSEKAGEDRSSVEESLLHKPDDDVGGGDGNDRTRTFRLLPDVKELRALIF